MAGTARVKRLGALALLASLLVPAPAAAAQERQSEKEWVWGEWGDEKVRAQRERPEAERAERRERERERRAEKDRERLLAKQRRLTEKRERLARKREALAEKREALAGKRERLAKKRERIADKLERNAEKREGPSDKRRDEKRRHDDHDYRRRHDHHHGGYGLVYGGPRDRPRHYRPRPYYRPPPRPRARRSTYVVHLTGDQVVPPGPPDTSGAAHLLLIWDHWGHEGRICYRLSLRGPDANAPLRAHLHAGRAGDQNGPEVFDLDLPGNGRRACRDANPNLVRQITWNHGSYYLDVHFGTINPGVIRGQLVRAYRN